MEPKGSVLRVAMKLLLTGVILGLFYFLLPSIELDNHEATRIHSILAEFVKNKQLVIETFPPLSYILEQFDTSMLGVVVMACQMITVSILLSAIEFRIGVIGFLILAVFEKLYGFENYLLQATPLSTSQVLGETILFGAMLCCHQNSPPLGHVNWLLHYFYALDILLVTGVLLGARMEDTAFCVFIVYCKRMEISVLSSSRKKRNLFKTFSALLLISILKVLVMAGTFLAVFAFTYPLSETSFGGNYNLRFLPPTLRRDLRPPIESYVSLNRVDNVTLPYYAIAPDIPLSLYIESGGFLWTEHYVWDMASGKFQTEEYIAERETFSTDEEYRSEKELRAVFMDKFNTIGPWFFEQVSENHGDEEDQLRGAFLWPGKEVYLRSYETDRFMTVANDSQAHTDYYDNINPDDDGIRRLRISANSGVSVNSKWQILYNPTKDEGFQLWNPKAGCYLATSFRTYPNLHGRPSNDTMLHTFGLELEACCTNFPSSSASTFYAIDGFRKPLPPQSILPPLFRWWEMLVRGHWTYAIAIARAMTSLKDFRQKHGELQGTPEELLHLSEKHQYSASQSLLMDSLICANILLTICKAMREQRSNHRHVRKVPPKAVHLRSIQISLPVTTTCYTAVRFIYDACAGPYKSPVEVSLVVFCLIDHLKRLTGI